MTIQIEYETEVKLDLDYRRIIELVACQAAEQEGCPYETEINVVLTDNENIKEVNREYRGIDDPTDVLSFPMISYIIPAGFDDIKQELESSPEDYFNPDTGELMLGDIMVSVEKVMEQAEKYGHSTERELAFLIAHSMLHLFGYDHMEPQEAEIMEKKQRQILDTLGIRR